MNMILKNKKILFLGGQALICDAVNAAKSMGVHTVVTDWYPTDKSPAKLIADQYFMTSTSDVDAIVKLIKDEKIDGVITGFTDSTLPYYYEICKKAKLPCYITQEQIHITTNKNAFKDLCNRFFIPVVEECQIDKILCKEQLSKIKYPVIVKPVDNSGGRGIKICQNEQELISGYKNALVFSDSKKVLVERYMTNKEVSIFYLLENGKIHLTLMGNRHTKKNQKGSIIPLPVAYTFPSKYLAEYQKDLNDKVIKMFRSIGMQNGIVFIQSFIEDGKCIFYEMGFRLTGSLEYKIIDKICGINPLKMMISYAVTGNMEVSADEIIISPNHKPFASNITFLSRPGKIERIVGLDEINRIPGVIDVVPSYKEGDSVPDNALGTLNQVVARVFIVAQTKEELIEIMDKAHNLFDVRSDKNESMVLDKLDVNEINSYV